MKEKKPANTLKIKDITLIGVMISTLEVAKISFSFIPNVELVSLLIILYTLFLQKKIIYVIFIFTLIEGLLYGFSLWWFSYLYVWYILAFFTYLFRSQTSALFFAILGSIFGFSFGALLSPVTFFFNLASHTFSNSLTITFTWWIAGIPWDITHGIANFIVIFILYRPLYQILIYLRKAHLL